MKKPEPGQETAVACRENRTFLRKLEPPVHPMAGLAAVPNYPRPGFTKHSSPPPHSREQQPKTLSMSGSSVTAPPPVQPLQTTQPHAPGVTGDCTPNHASAPPPLVAS